MSRFSWHHLRYHGWSGYFSIRDFFIAAWALSAVSNGGEILWRPSVHTASCRQVDIFHYMIHRHILTVPGDRIDPFAAVSAVQTSHILHLHVACAIRILKLCGPAIRILVLKPMTQKRILISCCSLSPQSNRTISIMFLYKPTGDSGKIPGGFRLMVNVLQHITVCGMGGMI